MQLKSRVEQINRDGLHFNYKSTAVQFQQKFKVRMHQTPVELQVNEIFSSTSDFICH